MKTLGQGTLDFFGHVMTGNGSENLMISGKVRGRRARGRQGMGTYEV